MKYLTVYTTSSRLPRVKSQQGVHHLRTSEQALEGRGERNGWGWGGDLKSFNMRTSQI